MDSTRSLRRLLYLACSNGCPTPGDETVYYSDNTYTEEVGYCSSDCCNCTTCTCSGEITPYAITYQVNWLWCN